VPAVLHELRTMFERYFSGVHTVVVGPGVRTGVPLLYDNPREVGPDRVVNTLAAHTLYGGPAIVVDFGTSTNFDVVSAKGEFLGGALAPGIEISVDALACPRRAAVQGRAQAAALGHRQDDERGAAVGPALRLRRARSTAWCGASRASSRPSRWSSRPAGCRT
jgi:pantothenate kinase type III